MNATSRVAEGIVWCWRLTKGWLPQLLGMSATVFSLIWGVYGENAWAHGTWAFVVAIILLLSSLVTQIVVQRPSYMELSKNLEHVKKDSIERAEAIARAFEVLLRQIAVHCDIAENSDRASLYYFHKQEFVMIARWSKQPEYTKAGRGRYPVGQGAIGKAWQNGSVAMVLPSSRPRWNSKLENAYGFPKDSAKALAMHCVSIAALRIEVAHTSVGVIAFESTETSRACQKTLDCASNSRLYATLSELVGAVAQLTPSVKGPVSVIPETKLKSVREWKEAPVPPSA